MELYNFFNPYNIDHIRAYKTVCDTGIWPEGFLPEDVHISYSWRMHLAGKCADAWIEQAMAGHIIGIPRKVSFHPPVNG